MPSLRIARTGHRVPTQLGMTTMALLMSSILSGCSICSSPFDDFYGTYGTRTPRTDMVRGRVGSIFSDPELMGSAQLSDDPESSSAYVEDGVFEPDVWSEESVDGLGETVVE